MESHLIVKLLVFMLFLVNIVVSIEPITMGVVGSAIGKSKSHHFYLHGKMMNIPVSGVGYWLFGSKDEDKNSRRTKIQDSISYCTYYECCTPKHIIYDIEGLKADLKDRLFGQHIVNATLIPALRSHVKNLKSSEKPLVFSFHGTMGTGKNFVSDLIIKHFYKNGENSKYVHRYYARRDFPIESEVGIYRVSGLNILFFHN